MCQFTIQTQLGALWRISWAHPEFGQVLACCGADQRVTVYEEAEAPDNLGRVVSRWNKRAELGDARQSVNDVKFAPRHMGLKLASGSADGLIRLYEVTDVMNLTHWPLTDEIRGDDGHPVTSFSWCTSQFDPAMMVVGGESGIARVWGYAPSVRKWVCMLELGRHAGRLNDVCWAPNIGRSYHLLSSAGVDGNLCLWRLQPENPTDGGGAGSMFPSLSAVAAQVPRDAAANVKRLPGSTADAIHIATFNDASGPVWRTDWNVTGTVLASACDDGRLRLRRTNLGGRWEVVAEMDAGDRQQLRDGEHDGSGGAQGHGMPTQQGQQQAWNQQQMHPGSMIASAFISPSSTAVPSPFAQYAASNGSTGPGSGQLNSGSTSGTINAFAQQQHHGGPAASPMQLPMAAIPHHLQQALPPSGRTAAGQLGGAAPGAHLQLQQPQMFSFGRA